MPVAGVWRDCGNVTDSASKGVRGGSRTEAFAILFKTELFGAILHTIG